MKKEKAASIEAAFFPYRKKKTYTALRQMR
jgi:hypothetical protein